MRLHSKALFGAFALSGILACAAPSDRTAKSEPASEEEVRRRPPEDDARDDEAMRVVQAQEDRLASEEGRQKNLERQRQTVRDMRSLATALFSWLNHEVEQGGVGHREIWKATIDAGDYPLISQEELEHLLVPRYIQRLPAEDGWGHPFEVRVKVNDVFSNHVYLIRSPGRDGEYSTDSYLPGRFDEDKFDEDIVWADGSFVRWPEGGV